jgi:hypothetical protein
MDPRNYKEEKCKKKNILMEAGKETRRNTNAGEKVVYNNAKGSDPK